MALTPGQQQCIESLDGSIAVSAGAGSGKTFTLTRRIAYALTSGAASDIDEILAITFTNKAAAEIKARVKDVLMQEGLTDQALRVEDAWISTIHGMCGRILREHAIELGIDPDFTILEEVEAAALRAQAVDAVLSMNDELGGSEDFDELFREYQVRSGGGSGSAGSFWGAASIESMLEKLLDHASSSPQGLEGIEKGPAPLAGLPALEDAIAALRAYEAAARDENRSASRDRIIEAIETALPEAEKALREAELGESGPIEPKEVARLIASLPYPPKNFGSTTFKEFARETQVTIDRCMASARCVCAEESRDELIALADLAASVYATLKRMASALDNNDLLTFTARAFDEHPSIAASYTERFRIVMVDEFQDTDRMQVSMISRMAGTDWERLCTVGDAQQSIYRFRGADVGVFRRHVADVKAMRPDGVILLPDNFRSHDSILRFVDRVFEQPDAFGGEFMSLTTSRNEERVKSPYLGASVGIPRITLAYVSSPYGKGLDALARESQARFIARRFAELREAGQRAGDMVVLLGGMTYADVFARAMRDEGFACVITGGSVFGRAPEVNVIVSLAKVLANPHGTKDLFQVLSSPMFGLSADDFLELGTGYDGEHGADRARRIDAGMTSLSKRLAQGGGESLSPQIKSAVRLLEKALSHVGTRKMSRIMADLVRDSGWLSRLESQGAEGQAVAGNILKALRIVEDGEKRGCVGPRAVATRLEGTVTLSKEAPGALASSEGDFVRIMTVHASKGLEFPVVAVAEMHGNRSSSSKLLTVDVEGKRCLSLAPGASCDDFKDLKVGDVSAVGKSAKEDTLLDDDLTERDLVRIIESTTSAAEFRQAIKAYDELGEAEEHLRLLYVALTRAKEALIVTLRGGDQGGVKDGVPKCLLGAVDSKATAWPADNLSFDIGAAEPASYVRIKITSEDEQESDSESQPESESGLASASEPEAATPFDSSRWVLYEAPEGMEVESLPFSAARAGVFSYTALAHGAAKAPSRVIPTNEDDEEEEWRNISARLSYDEDKATDLGIAFHQLAQFAVLSRSRHDGALMRPDDERVATYARRCRLSADQSYRLDKALDSWFDSKVAAASAAHANVSAEVPFMVALPNPEAPDGIINLEGEIDLLAYDDESCAYLVDYKTGGRFDETDEELHEKHLLQAQCYAYVLLRRGFKKVLASFVRIEQSDPDEPSEPQCVVYDFMASELGELEASIVERYNSDSA